MKQARKLNDSSKGASISNLFIQRASTSTAASATVTDASSHSRVTELAISGDQLVVKSEIEQLENEDQEIVSKQDLTLSNITWEFSGENKAL